MMSKARTAWRILDSAGISHCSEPGLAWGAPNDCSRDCLPPNVADQVDDSLFSQCHRIRRRGWL